MGSLARHIGTAALTALVASFALTAPGTATEIQAKADASGLRIVGPDQVMSDYCEKDANGVLWLRLPGGQTFELVMSTEDPVIANPGDGAFHAYDESEVRAALSQVRFPLDGLHAEVLLLPYPRRVSLESGAGPGLILLSPGVAPMPAERQHAEFVHELGHVVQYQWMPDGDVRWLDYRRQRGIEDGSIYSATAMHAYRPHEIFAEDFRALFGGVQANYSGSVENATLTPPAEVPGLEAFMRALPGAGVLAAKLQAGANPARGAVSFALAAPTDAVLDLFDVSGRRLATLGASRGGAATVWRWNGRDAAGRLVPRGIVLARVRSERGPATRLSWIP